MVLYFPHTCVCLYGKSSPKMAATNTPTIKIADDQHPTKLESNLRTSARGDARLAGGIFNARSRSRGSLDHRSDAVSPGGAEEGDEWQQGNAKTKQIFRGTTLLW